MKNKVTITMGIILVIIGSVYFVKGLELEKHPRIKEYEVSDYSLKSDTEGYIGGGAGYVFTEHIYMVAIKTEKGIEKIKCNEEDTVLIYDLKPNEQPYLKEYKKFNSKTYELHLHEDIKGRKGLVAKGYRNCSWHHSKDVFKI